MADSAPISSTTPAHTGWPGHLAGLLVWLSLIGIVARFVDDVILTAEQRQRLKDYTAAAWIWLDDRKGDRLVAFLLSESVQWVVTVSSALVVGVLVLAKNLGLLPEGDKALYHFSLTISHELPWIALATIVVVIPVALIFWQIHWRIGAWIGRTRRLGWYLLRVLAGALGSIAGAFAVVYPMQLIFGTEGTSGSAAIALIPFVLLLFGVMLEIGALVILFYVAFILFLLVWAGLLLLWVVRLFLHRLATHEKGPVYVIMVLVGVAAGLVRWVLGKGN